MNRGTERRRIFIDEEDYKQFLLLLAEIKLRYSVHPISYALMSNHYHLLLHDRSGELCRAMRHLNGVYTQRFNRMHRRDGPLFRGRFRSKLVEKDKNLTEVVRYIHLNTVRAKLVRTPQAYAYSSHKWYYKNDIPDWLDAAPLRQYFTNGRALHEFVMQGIPRKQLSDIEASLPLIGSDGGNGVRTGFLTKQKTGSGPISTQS